MFERGRLFGDWVRAARRSLSRLRIAQIPLILGALFGLPLILVLVNMAQHHWVNATDDFRASERMRQTADLTRLLYLLGARADLGLEPCPPPLQDHDAILVPLDAELNASLVRLAEMPLTSAAPVPSAPQMFDPQPISESLRTLPTRRSDVAARHWRDQHRLTLERVTESIASLAGERRQRHSHPSTATSSLTEFLLTRLPHVVLDIDTALEASHASSGGPQPEAQRWVFLSALERARICCEGVDVARRRATSILPPFAIDAAQGESEVVSVENLRGRFTQLQNDALVQESWPPAETEKFWRDLSQLRRDLERFTQDSISFVERVLHRHALNARWTSIAMAFTTIIAVGTIIAVMLAWRWRLLKSLSAIQNIAKTSPAEPGGALNEFDSLNEDLIPILRDRQRMASLLQTSASRAQEAAARAVLAERNAHQLEEQIELLTATSQDGLWDWDVRSDHVLYSSQVWKMLGYRPESMPQMSFAAFAEQIHPDDREAVQKARADHLDRRLPYACEFRLLAVNGEYRWFHERGHAKWDSKGRPTRMVGTLRDVTERRRMLAEQERFITDLQTSRDEIAAQAAQLRQQTEELWVSRERAEVAVRAKTEFLANMSHELRTPLTAILGYTDLLSNEATAKAGALPREEMLDSIRSNGMHLLELIDDILDLSKIEAGHMTIAFIPCKSEEILDQARRWLELRAKEKGLAFEVRTHGLLPAVFLSDPKRLRQILVNLLGNAIKFTQRGRIVLEMYSGGETDDTIHFTVTDTGIGMTAEQIANLYRPFDQADSTSSRRFGGTGLGLSISQRLAGLLGGEISVVSEPGRGSAFTLSLRVTVPSGVEWCDVSAGDCCELSLPDVRGDLTGLRFLVVDDVECNRRHLGFLLGQAGANVSFAENGEAAVLAIKTARERSQAFHLILMDTQMPIMDGDDATRLLRAEGVRQPIIAMTTNTAVEHRQHCLDIGYDDCLAKPIDRSQLLELCARCCRTDVASPV